MWIHCIYMQRVSSGWRTTASLHDAKMISCKVIFFSHIACFINLSYAILFGYLLAVVLINCVFHVTTTDPMQTIWKWTIAGRYNQKNIKPRNAANLRLITIFKDKGKWTCPIVTKYGLKHSTYMDCVLWLATSLSQLQHGVNLQTLSVWWFCAFLLKTINIIDWNWNHITTSVVLMCWTRQSGSHVADWILELSKFSWGSLLLNL